MRARPRRKVLKERRLPLSSLYLHETGGRGPEMRVEETTEHSAAKGMARAPPPDGEADAEVPPGGWVLRGTDIVVFFFACRQRQHRRSAAS